QRDQRAPGWEHHPNRQSAESATQELLSRKTIPRSRGDIVPHLQRGAFGYRKSSSALLIPLISSSLKWPEGPKQSSPVRSDVGPTGPTSAGLGTSPQSPER